MQLNYRHILHVSTPPYWTAGTTHHIFIIITRSIFIIHLPCGGVTVLYSKLEGVQEGASDYRRKGKDRREGGEGRGSDMKYIK